MKSIPKHAKAYNRSPAFTEKTVPASLLKSHTTKKGVWGLIQIESGQLEYIIEGGEKYLLSRETFGVVEPEKPHHVKLVGGVSFFIEFYQ